MDPRDLISPELVRLAAASNSPPYMKSTLQKAANTIQYLTDTKSDEREDHATYLKNTEELREQLARVTKIVNTSWEMRFRLWWQTRKIVRQLKKQGILVKIR